MKERPIIFTAESVRAILSGNKTQTRRVVKTQPKVELFPFIGADNKPNGEFAFVDHPRVVSKHLRCPYGVPGDRLWVKESFNIGWLDNSGILYRANGGSAKACGYPSEPKWQSSMFMPRFASRITLEITDVRVQRVQDISYGDISVEGWQIQPERSSDPEVHRDAARDWFMDLWDSINAKRGYSWESNPWVWAVTFKRVDS